MSTDDLANRLAAVLQRIHDAAVAGGRSAGDVRLVAVSKTVTAEVVAGLYACGQRAFGENRVPELVAKAGALPADCEWHMIGHLQGNKARPAVQVATWIHSVDSAELIQRVDRLASEAGRSPRILLQINVSGEFSKSGVSPEGAEPLLEAALRSPHLVCGGLMTMAPYGAPVAEQQRIFAGLRQLRDRLVARFGVPLPDLSMGMSDDFEAAVREGATLVRVGTAIFGPR